MLGRGGGCSYSFTTSCNSFLNRRCRTRSQTFAALFMSVLTFRDLLDSWVLSNGSTGDINFDAMSLHSGDNSALFLLFVSLKLRTKQFDLRTLSRAGATYDVCVKMYINNNVCRTIPGMKYVLHLVLLAQLPVCILMLQRDGDDHMTVGSTPTCDLLHSITAFKCLWHCVNTD